MSLNGRFRQNRPFFPAIITNVLHRDGKDVHTNNRKMKFQ